MCSRINQPRKVESIPEPGSDVRHHDQTRFSLPLRIVDPDVCRSCARRHGHVKPRPSTTPGHTRTYYIAADEVSWDYVPGGMDGIAGKPFTSVGLFMSGPTPGAKPAEKSVPTAYVKTLYREYT